MDELIAMDKARRTLGSSSPMSVASQFKVQGVTDIGK